MTPLFEYTVGSIIWAAAGLVVGYIGGRLTHTVDRMADDVETITSVVAHEGAAVPIRRRRRVSSEQIVGAVVVLLGLFTVAQGIYQSSATRRLADCHATYSNRFADALDARTRASASAQQALDDLMNTVGQLTTGAPTPQAREAFRAALAEYLAKREDAKREQQRNPYPPAPRDLCR